MRCFNTSVLIGCMTFLTAGSKAAQFDLIIRNGTIYDGSGEVVGIYPAANNAASGSRGPWAAGEYDYVWHAVHAGDAPNRVVKQARRWVEAHQAELLERWDEFQR